MTAYFGAMPENIEQSFDETFGKMGVASGQVYAGGVTKSEYEAGYESQMAMNKSWVYKANLTTSNDTAASTSYSATSGSLPSLIPLSVSPDIIDLSRKMTPVYELIPKMAVRNKFFDWNKLTYATTNASFKYEDAAMAETNDSYARSVITMKSAYAVGRVSGQMQVFSANYINAEQNEVMVKTRQLLQLLEKTIINGNSVY
jgi:HK97 family phage major capsid protein